jgi:hypothetical protein
VSESTDGREKGTRGEFSFTIEIIGVHVDPSLKAKKYKENAKAVFSMPKQQLIKKDNVAHGRFF